MTCCCYKIPILNVCCSEELQGITCQMLIVFITRQEDYKSFLTSLLVNLQFFSFSCGVGEVMLGIKSWAW
jgi:hypothetical protein